ncbi:MAG: helix-turn-helix transcriptional regulator [Pseudomonadota bacterium]
MPDDERALRRLQCERATRYFGLCVLHARELRGWTQQELANEIGCTRTAITKIESGRNPPTGEQIFLLCALLDLSVFEMVEGLEGKGDDPAPDELILPRDDLIGLIRFKFAHDDNETNRLLRLIDLDTAKDEDLRSIFRKVWESDLNAARHAGLR